MPTVTITTLSTVTGSIHRRQRDTWLHHRKTSAWPAFIINQPPDNFMIARLVKPSESEALPSMLIYDQCPTTVTCASTQSTQCPPPPSAGRHRRRVQYQRLGLTQVSCRLLCTMLSWLNLVEKEKKTWLYLHIWLLILPSYRSNLLCEENTKGNTG